MKAGAVAVIAPPDPAKVTVTPGLGTEPARDVEPERLTRHHGPQP
jgi:hypothetical protein